MRDLDRTGAAARAPAFFLGLAAACVGAPAAAAPQGVTAAGYTVMHTFQKPDGFGVFAELAQGADGTIYGTG